MLTYLFIFIIINTTYLTNFTYHYLFTKDLRDSRWEEKAGNHAIKELLRNNLVNMIINSDLNEAIGLGGSDAERLLPTEKKAPTSTFCKSNLKKRDG